MIRTVKIRTNGSLKIRMSAAKGVENALLKKGGAVRTILKPRTTGQYEGFMIIPPSDFSSLASYTQASVLQSIPIARRAFEEWRLRLWEEARRTRQIDLLLRYWPEAQKWLRRAPEGKKHSGRKFYDTFDDCSSVWTHESNWKRREA